MRTRHRVQWKEVAYVFSERMLIVWERHHWFVSSHPFLHATQIEWAPARSESTWTDMETLTSVCPKASLMLLDAVHAARMRCTRKQNEKGERTP